MSAPKFKPNEEQYDLGAVRALDAQQRGPEQALKISSDRPLRCSSGTCQREIRPGEAAVIFIVGDGRSCIFHFVCVGMNTAGTFEDPAYRSHLAARLREAMGVN